MRFVLHYFTQSPQVTKEARCKTRVLRLSMSLRLRCCELLDLNYTENIRSVNRTENLIMKNITLTKGKVAIVDDEDYDWLMQWKWHYGTRYAARAVHLPQRKTVWMHREIAKTPPNMMTDHINGNALDNRKSNLRICTNSQNQANRRPQRIDYKGVYCENNKYIACVTIKGNKNRISIHDTAEAAARAYDKKARELFGEFARPNFPE